MDLLQQLYQFDTAEISDALDACGIEGALLGIKPILHGAKIVGPAFTVKYFPYEEKQAEFKSAGNYIDDVPAHSVIMIDNAGRQDCTTWGDILTQVALMRHIGGTVVFGAIRDIHFIRESNYPLYASAVYMRSGKNRVYKSAQQCELSIHGIRIQPGDIIMGDDNGVVVVPQEHLQEIIEKATNIKLTEQAIITSVKSGAKLEDARKQHRYDQPWLSGDKK
jgi:regulator of RNase E activity RraA